MRAFFNAKGHERDGIAIGTLHMLKQHYNGKLRLSDGDVRADERSDSWYAPGRRTKRRPQAQNGFNISSAPEQFSRNLMTDHLLKRADQAIRNGLLIRKQCLWNLMQARAAAVRIQTTVRRAQADRSNSRQLGFEPANRAADLENREANIVADSSDKT
jgi:hypothetical protein